jgi:hypothetical protein
MGLPDQGWFGSTHIGKISASSTPLHATLRGDSGEKPIALFTIAWGPGSDGKA